MAEGEYMVDPAAGQAVGTESEQRINSLVQLVSMQLQAHAAALPYLLARPSSVSWPFQPGTPLGSEMLSPYTIPAMVGGGAAAASNWLFGTNFSTSPDKGWYPPAPGRTYEDAQRQQSNFRNWMDFSQSYSGLANASTLNLVDRAANKLGIGNMMKDENGNLVNYAQALNNPLLRPAMNMAATWLGAPSEESRQAVFEARGAIGSVALGRTRSERPVDDDTGRANKFMESLIDMAYHKDNDGKPIFMLPNQANLRGLSPDDFFKTSAYAARMGMPVEGSAGRTNIQGLAEMTSAMSRITEGNVGEAFSQIATGGALGSPENFRQITTNLHVLYNALMEAGTTARTLHEVGSSSTILAQALEGGVSTLTGKAGMAAGIAPIVGYGIAKGIQPIMQGQGDLVNAGLLAPGDQVTSDQAAIVSASLATRAMQSKLYSSAMVLSSTPGNQYAGLRQDWDKAMQTGDIGTANRIAQDLQRGGIDLQPGSPSMQQYEIGFSQLPLPDRQAVDRGVRRLVGADASMHGTYAAYARSMGGLAVMMQLEGKGGSDWLPEVARGEQMGVVAQLRKEERDGLADEIERMDPQAAKRIIGTQGFSGYREAAYTGGLEAVDNLRTREAGNVDAVRRRAVMSKAYLIPGFDRTRWESSSAAQQDAMYEQLASDPVMQQLIAPDMEQFKASGYTREATNAARADGAAYGMGTDKLSDTRLKILSSTAPDEFAADQAAATAARGKDMADVQVPMDPRDKLFLAFARGASGGKDLSDAWMSVLSKEDRDDIKKRPPAEQAAALLAKATDITKKAVVDAFPGYSSAQADEATKAWLKENADPRGTGLPIPYPSRSSDLMKLGKVRAQVAEDTFITEPDQFWNSLTNDYTSTSKSSTTPSALKTTSTAGKKGAGGDAGGAGGAGGSLTIVCKFELDGAKLVDAHIQNANGANAAVTDRNGDSFALTVGRT